MNTGIFAAFLKQVIEQRLRANAADGKRARLVIIMDNLALHKTKEVAKLCAAYKVCCLCLRPYRPEWNLAEFAIRNVSMRMRKLASNGQ